MSKHWKRIVGISSVLLLMIPVLTGCNGDTKKTEARPAATAGATATTGATTGATATAAATPGTTAASSAVPSAPAPSASPAAAANNSPTGPAEQPTQAPKAVTRSAHPESSGPIIAGTYVGEGSNPMYSRWAKITQTGPNTYHLEVNAVAGLGYNNGGLDAEFVYDGERLQQVPSGGADAEGEGVLDPEITLSFDQHLLVVDYPDEGYGGLGAEPKGEYYLSIADLRDSPFLNRVFTAIDQAETYWNEEDRSEVLTFETSESSQILLARFYETAERDYVVSEYVLSYDKNTDTLESLGEIDSISLTELKNKLLSLGLDEDLIYQILHKDYYDRFLEIQHLRFDNGEPTAMRDDHEFKLTEEEAFYIVMGIEDATSNSDDSSFPEVRSRFYQEVDHADEQTVTIHLYEVVDDGDGESHTATSDWLEVDRSTGRVTSMFEDL